MTDALTEVLGMLRIRTTLYAMSRLPDDWGVAFPAGPGAYFHVLDGGEGWLEPDGGGRLRLSAGDVVLLPHGTAHRLTQAGGGRIRASFDPVTWVPNRLISIAGPGADGAGPDGADPDGAGPDGEGGPTLVCGAIEVHDAQAHPLLGLLPTVVRIRPGEPGAEGLSLTLRLLHAETRGSAPGSQTLLARLGDVLLIQVLRAWLAQDGVDPDVVGRVGQVGVARGGWLAALGDAQVGAALAAIHAEPALPWTVGGLAARAGLSRSRFAERFTALVGEAPLTYLTRWRLNTAARLLREQNATVREVGRAVGYASEPAFSRAFTRHHGVPPSRLRRRAS